MNELLAYMAKAERQWRQAEPPSAIVVQDRVYTIGPGGLGTEDPDTSEWCTRNPVTCEMIVLPGGLTKARMKHFEPPTKRPRGTCMLCPPQRCKYLKGGNDGP